MKTLLEKDWIALDGSLEKIDFEGESYFRYPRELVEFILKTYSKPGDWVLDPFAGFGTTIQVAQAMKRHGVGFEVDQKRAEFGNQNLHDPNKIINDQVENLTSHDLPKFDLVVTSPPYIMVDIKDDPWGEGYFQDMEKIFGTIRTVLKSNAKVILEVSNVSTEQGFRPLVWQFGETISKVFSLEREVVRCNTGNIDAGPGVQHSSILVFKL